MTDLTPIQESDILCQAKDQGKSKESVTRVEWNGMKRNGMKCDEMEWGVMRLNGITSEKLELTNFFHQKNMFY